jgi:hypothetical protein
MRNHRPAAKRAQRTLAEADRAEEAIEILAAFVRRRRVLAGDDPAIEALGVLRVDVDNARHDAERVLRERSRKTELPAARSAGIGWLAESVQGLSGKPHTRIVADLAIAVLSGEVTEEAVRKAKTPRERLAQGRYPKPARSAKK